MPRVRPKACSAFTMWVFARIASGWETRQGLTVVVVYIEDRVFVDAASQKSTVDWAVWYKADTQPPGHTSRTPFSSYQPVHQMVLALDSRQRTNGVGLTDCFGTDLATYPSVALYLP